MNCISDSENVINGDVVVILLSLFLCGIDCAVCHYVCMEESAEFVLVFQF